LVKLRNAAKDQKDVGMSENENWLQLRGTPIKEDVYRNICITDLWKIANEPSSKTPSDWKRLPTTKELVQALMQNLGKSQDKAKTKEETVLYTKGGRGGGTYAHPILAVAFAEYLSAALAIDVKDVYLRYRTGDLTLVDEVLKKAEASRKFQSTRDVSKQTRERFEGTLASHGVASGWPMGYVTNAIYQILLGGKKNEVAKARGLPATAVFRDHLKLEELVQTMATEVMASDRIEDKNCYGREECHDATKRSAFFIKEAFDREREDRKAQFKFAPRTILLATLAALELEGMRLDDL